MQAGLHNGVFKIAKLTGQFYGGAVDFSGTIDAGKDALALGLKGSLQGIYLSEMLRGTAGTNNFGNQHLMVSVDGKITVMNIELKGSGTTPEQIRNTLSGSGQVSGYLYPAVAGGSLGFASFATGLGSIFSTEMGFNSAVLAGFINHQSPITGELLLSGNTVTLQNHKVQGQDLEEFKHVKRWAEEIAKRPAVQKGMAVGANLSTDVTKLPPEEQARIRKLMYNQRAIPVA